MSHFAIPIQPLGPAADSTVATPPVLMRLQQHPHYNPHTDWFGILGCRCHGKELAAESELLGTVAGGEKSVMPDAMEPIG
jgi:hypothetical protein